MDTDKYACLLIKLSKIKVAKVVGVMVGAKNTNNVRLLIKLSKHKIVVVVVTAKDRETYAFL